MKKNLITLAQFIKEQKMSTQKFCNETGLSYSYIARIKNTVNPKVEVDTISKIYNSTGLECHRWLDLPKFWEPKVIIK